MDSKEIKEIMKKLLKDENNIMQELDLMSSDEIVRLKANINSKLVHCDKWMTIVIPIIAIAISIIGILYNEKIDSEFFILYAYLFLAIVVLFLHMFSQLKKEKYVKILCYIDEYNTSLYKESNAYLKLHEKNKINDNKIRTNM